MRGVYFHGHVSPAYRGRRGVYVGADPVSVRALDHVRIAAQQNPAPFWVAAATDTNGQPWINVVSALGTEGDARDRFARVATAPHVFAALYASDGAGGFSLLDAWGPGVHAYVGVSLGDVAGVLGGPLGVKLSNALGGREISDEEIRKSMAVATQAVAPLVDARASMMRAWSPSTPLSRDQMTTIMQNALLPARETEKNLSAMVDKVPAHWEATVRSEGGLPSLRQAISEAPGFDALIAIWTKDGKAVVVPGFRAWIDHLLSRTEDGVTAISYVSDVLPDWLRMRDMLSAMYRAAVDIINAAVKVVEDPGKYLKYAAIGLGAIGLVVIATRGR